MEIYVVELSESIYHFNFDLVFIIAIIRNQIAIKCDSKVLWLSSHVHLIWLNFMRVIQMQTGKENRKCYKFLLSIQPISPLEHQEAHRLDVFAKLHSTMKIDAFEIKRLKKLHIIP